MDGSLKGIVSLKKVVPNRYKFFLLNTKEDILKNFGNPTVDGPTDSQYFFYILLKSMGY